MSLTFARSFFASPPVFCVAAQFMKSGLTMTKERNPLVDPTLDQFVMHFVDDKLIQEPIIRLKNGYPSTKRQAQEWDERNERNKAAYVEQFLKVCLLFCAVCFYGSRLELSYDTTVSYGLFAHWINTVFLFL